VIVLDTNVISELTRPARVYVIFVGNQDYLGAGAGQAVRVRVCGVLQMVSRWLLAFAQRRAMMASAPSVV
jgi:predicted nucleic acid-binding protein